MNVEAMTKVRHYPLNRPFIVPVYGGGRMVIRIRQATVTGYAECAADGVFDVAYETSLLRRARVQDGGKVSGAIMAGECTYCTLIEYDE